MRIVMIGAGPGVLSLVSQYALDLICNADRILTSERLASIFSPLNNRLKCVALGELKAEIQSEAIAEKHSAKLEQPQERLVVILVSGDVGFYSLSNTLLPLLKEHDVEWVNGFNSMQYLASLLKIPYDQIPAISVHGRETLVVPHVCYNPFLFILTGGKTRVQDVLGQLVHAGLGDASVFVGENLSLPDQKLSHGTARELAETQFDSLAVMLVRNDAYVPTWKTVRDDDFERGPVPMTKQEIRDVCLSRLNIQPTDRIYDIGAGTGAVSVAMARRAYAGEVLAIEKNPEALELLAKNRTKLGAFNIRMVAGEAPQAIEGLPVPDKIFIGGSNGQISQILDQVLDLNPLVKIVVTAITLETLQETLGALKNHQIHPDVICLNIARAETTGRYQLMKAQNPIYIISGGMTE